MKLTRVLAVSCIPLLLAIPAGAQAKKPRARDLGIPFQGEPGTLNAITDVAGVEVGFSTIIFGEGKLVEGKGPARTGVTVIHPRGKTSKDSVFAAGFNLNGNGEMTGMQWVTEGGFNDGPIAITNTHSVGLVRDAIIEWQVKTGNKFTVNTFGPFYLALPVVAETADVPLNDINGFHVKKEHVFAALDSATAGPVSEGNVGGGTGMVCHGWKGGTGTASRKLPADEGGYTVGVLVQANHGGPETLTIGGVMINDELKPRPPHKLAPKPGSGSIIIVIATDAPVLPHQLSRIAKRAAIGVGRVGGMGDNSSGDIFIAFSTANPNASSSDKPVMVSMLTNDNLDGLFYATVQATEEAIVNALIAAETMTGADGFTIDAIPHDKLLEVLRGHGRLTK